MTRANQFVPECVACHVRQAVSLLARSGAQDGVAQPVLRAVLKYLATADFNVSNPVLGAHVAGLVREATGVDDPYVEDKRRANESALELLPHLQRKVDEATDPFQVAMRLAIAGNVIDLGPVEHVGSREVRDAVEDALTCALPTEPVKALRHAVGQAERILYLADNAGEIVLDRLLLAQLPRNRVTCVVRGGPIINDATLDDARSAGVDRIVHTMSNGSRIPGTHLPACSEAFQRIFERADLIIAKGQGNYESLVHEQCYPVFFLFKVKCVGVAHFAGLPVGSAAVLGNDA